MFSSKKGFVMSLEFGLLSRERVFVVLVDKMKIIEEV